MIFDKQNFYPPYDYLPRKLPYVKKYFLRFEHCSEECLFKKKNADNTYNRPNADYQDM